ncbi:hypothetical protein [Streptomyces ziwulingensis]|uniref:Uncharacterized protein n=1 Tax=Streptomyces ziwulingensis TaxID=1045501 RepID=A0ABP9BZK7_9ACTN
MAAEHERHDGYERHDGHAEQDDYDQGYDGRGGDDGYAHMDALMAAITGEPLPPGAAEDAVLLAEHRAAEADVALLREQLAVIGGALTAPVRDTEPARAAVPPLAPASGRPHRPRSRRRPFAVALGALAVACAGAFVAGLGWLAVQGGPAGSQDSSAAKDADSAAEAPGGAEAPFGSPRYLACARLVAEGEVVAVEPVAGTGRHRVTLEVTRSYLPDPGERRVTFPLDDTTGTVTEGDLVLVGIPRHGDAPDAVFVGEAALAGQRARITAALPGSRTLGCG